MLSRLQTIWLSARSKYRAAGWRPTATSVEETGHETYGVRVTRGEFNNVDLSMDSNLEAFSCYPADGSFAAMPFQATAFAKYLNEVFLSYWPRLLSQRQKFLWGKTNLSHDGLNPAHVPYWRVNNPTL